MSLADTHLHSEQAWILISEKLVDLQPVSCLYTYTPFLPNSKFYSSSFQKYPINYLWWPFPGERHWVKPLLELSPKGRGFFSNRFISIWTLWLEVLRQFRMKLQYYVMVLCLTLHVLFEFPMDKKDFYQTCSLFNCPVSPVSVSRYTQAVTRIFRRIYFLFV